MKTTENRVNTRNTFVFSACISCVTAIMDFEMVQRMNVDELKKFLRLRGMKVSGKKAELVARVFCAYENDVQPTKTAEEVERELGNEYQAKLVIDDNCIPDPFVLNSGWLNEENGITSWPMISYPDIFNFLMFFPSELGSSELNDYKSCKAYSYFINGWLGPISYHPIDEKSKFCLLRADCRPSQRLNDTRHKIWVCVSKSDHKIKKAHCSCMAGMSETCNHVAALFFRVEAAVTSGLTNPSCTAKSCEWLPNRKDVKPIKLKDINLKRDDFGKQGKKSRRLVPSPKNNYNPIATTKLKKLTLTDIAKAFEDIRPDSIIHTAVPKPKIDFVREIISINPVNDSILSLDDIIMMSDSTDSFFEHLYENVTKDVIKKIEILTRGQAANKCWHTFRKGVITASKGHDIKTKMEKIKSQGDLTKVNLWNIFQQISGLTFVNPNIPALKYGREKEIYAVNEFFNFFSKHHKHAKLSDCGLFLDVASPFIGASPDRIISCDCCPDACLEVKCPYSINFKSPRDPDAKLSYLIYKDNEFYLNRNHKYSTQCQMQLGVTGLKKCYFMV